MKRANTYFSAGAIQLLHEILEVSPEHTLSVSLRFLENHLNTAKYEMDLAGVPKHKACVQRFRVLFKEYDGRGCFKFVRGAKATSDKVVKELVETEGFKVIYDEITNINGINAGIAFREGTGMAPFKIPRVTKKPTQSTKWKMTCYMPTKLVKIEDFGNIPYEYTGDAEYLVNLINTCFAKTIQ